MIQLSHSDPAWVLLERVLLRFCSSSAQVLGFCYGFAQVPLRSCLGFHSSPVFFLISLHTSQIEDNNQKMLEA